MKCLVLYVLTLTMHGLFCLFTGGEEARVELSSGKHLTNDTMCDGFSNSPSMLHKYKVTSNKYIHHFRECLEMPRSMFFSSAPCFLAKRFQLHALCSRKNGGVVRAPKEVLHKLQFFIELLYGGVCGAVPNTPLIPHK